MKMIVNVDEVSLATIAREVYAYDTDGEPVLDHAVTIGDLVAEKIVEELRTDEEAWCPVRHRFAEIRDEIIRERLAVLVDAAFKEGFQPTNYLGEPTGERTTLRKMIHDEAMKQLTQKSGVSTRRGQESTPVEAMVATAVTEAFRNELQQAVAAAKAMIPAEISTVVTEAIKDAMRSKA